MNFSPDQFTPPNDMQVFLPAGEVTGLAGILLAVYALVMFAYSMLGLISYVLHSLGLYTIAKRRGIHNSWLAWLPFGNLWILGSISDQYQYVVKGKIRNRRKAMLWLSIPLIPVCFIWFVILIVSAVSGSGFLLVIAVLIGLFTMAVTLTVVQYIAYYDLFTSCNRENAVLYLVLGIFIPVTLPFFVFACRKKDLGMPPRKQPVSRQAPMQIVEEAPVEPAAEDVAENAESQTWMETATSTEGKNEE